jgi:creatinine amidohydrolase/Fe(II)-dependent formamide hydrolase-like protein
MYQFERLTATAISQLLGEGTAIVVVPFGSIEYHGGHLPVGTDALLADAIGREVAERLRAVLAPTQRVGAADRHMDRAGTLTLGAATLTDVAVGIARSLARQRFRLIVLLSTHGGNVPALRAAVEQVDGERPDGVVVCAPQGDVGAHPGAHSGEWITSVMLALHPDLVELERADRQLARDLRSASAIRGHDHLELFVASVVREVASTASS